MEITFTKVSPVRWEAELVVSADFNLHIEKEKSGFLLIQQRGCESGGYDTVGGVNPSPSDLVFDFDFSALVYPKYIKVVSEVEPTYAEVVTDGEITEIKSQSKSVDVTSNGVTEVTPDSGYSYLTGVSVNVNVPQEGGGGTPAESTMEYWDISGLDLSDFMTAMAIKMAALFKNYTASTGMTSIVPYGQLALRGDISEWGVSYVAIDLSLKVMSQSTLITVGDMVYQALGEDVVASIPRITEEEFYTAL